MADRDPYPGVTLRTANARSAPRSSSSSPEVALSGASQGIQGIARFFLAAASLVFIVMTVYIVSGKRNVDSDWASYIAAAATVWFVVYFIATYFVARTPYLLTSSYVIAFSLFHLGITVPDGFNLFPDITWGTTKLAPWLDLAGWYSLMALASLSLGFAFGWRSGAQGVAPATTSFGAEIATRQTAMWAGVGLLLASVIFLGLAVASYGNIFAYERVEFFRGGRDSRGWGVFMMTLPSATILLCMGATTARAKILSTFFALFVVGFFLLIGYRSAALFPALVGIVLWAKTGNRIPTVVAAGLIAATIISIPAAGVWRTYNAYNEIDQETVVKSVESTEAKDTLEQGRTAGVLAHVLRIIPDEEPYRYGMTYLRTLPEAIPNVLPEIGDSKRGRVKNAVLKQDAISQLPPGSWLTYHLAPQKFHRGEGVGFTSVGEAYMNFGTLGVVIIFALIGAALGRLDSVNLLEHPYILIFAGALLWPFIRTVRNDFSNFVKPVGFIVIILLIWSVVTRIVPVIQRGDASRKARRAAEIATISGQGVADPDG